MKRAIAFTSVLLLLICSGCGSDSHASLAADGISTMKEMVTVLEGVKDEASAKSAKSQLTSLMEKLKSINVRQEKLPAPTEAELKEMDTKYGKEMEEITGKFRSQMFRMISDPKIAAVLQDIDMKGMK